MIVAGIDSHQLHPMLERIEPLLPTLARPHPRLHLDAEGGARHRVRAKPLTRGFAKEA